MPVGDLGEYLGRIGLAEIPQADPAGLARVVRAHRLAIAFENLDIMLGRGISLAPEAIFDKLVRRGRGGYCFEHNLLLQRMLALLGLPTQPILARARLQSAPGEIPPRTHLFLTAELEGRTWLADAGFGGSYAPPMPLAETDPVTSPDGIRHRLRRTGERGSPQGEWLLERSPDHGRTWQAQYSFDHLPAPPIDIELANHWTATRPGARFATVHIAGRVTERGTVFLTDHDYSATGEDSRKVEDPAEWHGLLHQTFGIPLTLDEVKDLPLFAR
ncbi:arylamine N-acetyltransferase [Novosphingobium flavum]|uniref:Arylamine N-acetyltransferase n=1 Tax=Novosphingobium flavum TaxID=1778672 RepID=A0A7X1FPW5_9SPHN|nr:arylamine N-acetyltransferase [Novosphingobium flavum]MBC2664674.1 arylamine N-acetyltransferase [Novosphingobium flavum]